MLSTKQRMLMEIRKGTKTFSSSKFSMLLDSCISKTQSKSKKDLIS